MIGNLLKFIMPDDLLTGKMSLRLAPMLIVVYGCLLPRELGVEVAGAALLPYRVLLMASAPFSLALLIRSPVRPSWIDLVAFLAAIWFVVSIYMAVSLPAAMSIGLPNTIDFGLAYLLGRASIRTPSDLRTIFLFLVPAAGLIVVILAAESISGKLILRSNLADFLNAPAPVFFYRFRFGLLRALGPFPHPILSGVFLVGLLPFAWYMTHNLKQRVLAVGAAFGAVFTVSSVAILGLILVVVFIALDLAQRISRLPIFLFVGLYLGLAMAAISVGSGNGLISFLNRRFLLDQGSGSYRLLIWEYGSAEVARTPWFGMGERTWIRPIWMTSDSVDSYWLALSMFYGLPLAIFAGLVMAGAMFLVGRSQRFRSAPDRNVGTGLIIFIFIAAFSGFTVHLWEGIHAWIIMICGASISLATQARITPSDTVLAPRPHENEPQANQFPAAAFNGQAR